MHRELVRAFRVATGCLPNVCLERQVRGRHGSLPPPSTVARDRSPRLLRLLFGLLKEGARCDSIDGARVQGGEAGVGGPCQLLCLGKAGTCLSTASAPVR